MCIGVVERLQDICCTEEASLGILPYPSALRLEKLESIVKTFLT